MLALVKALLLLFTFISFVNAATLYTFSKPLHMQMNASHQICGTYLDWCSCSVPVGALSSCSVVVDWCHAVFRRIGVYAVFRRIGVYAVFRRIGVTVFVRLLFCSVPTEYEIVILQRSTKEGVFCNEVKRFNLTVFGRDIALRLEPNTFVNDRLDGTKMYKTSIDDDLQFREVLYQYFPWKKSFKIYEDVANLTSVSIECGEDEIQMEGSIGDLIIKPVPSGLVIDGNVSVVEVLLGEANHTQRTKVNDSSTTEFSTSKGSAHLIYKGQVLKPDTDVLQDALFMLRSKFEYPLVDRQDIDYELNKTIDGLSGKSRRDVSVVYPEVLLLLADDIYDSFGGNTREVIKHYTYFMNEVSMRFKSLSNPKVVLALVGILAAQQVIFR
ncbi:hypothetical protein CEXT_82011 [Caerostris extrusa]|uniref:Uncharacterized protein n=1 Tax=Caerostris extrusa TaxID=172846 RepID=A0AAV4Q498_CAEEX|nr:hypothetical protein CEXT_82011 [Caerostris extrusa]